MGGGKHPDGVETYPADRHDLDSYREASAELARLQAPLLLDSNNPHARLFVAAFDGTGNSMYKDDPKNHTNVANVVQQLEAGLHRNVGFGYVEGPGTQDGWFASTRDMATGRTFEPRVERMYQQFAEQSKQWLREDPQAQISVAGIGFSRGAEQEAAFARLVHERGIQDPSGAQYRYDSARNIVGVEYTKPPLVPPGQVAQAVGLFDPVGTGEPRLHDRRLPPSVVSGFQITAEDERRDHFKSTSLLRPGFTEDSRFLNVTVGGAHSNIGGSYELNGLSIRSGNLMTDYLNSLSDRPLLDKRVEPDDPSLNVVHRSDKHQFFYTTRSFRDGERDRIDLVASKQQQKDGSVADPYRKEPIDPELDARFERRGVPIGAAPVRLGALDAGQPIQVQGGPAQGGRGPGGDEVERSFDRMVEAARNRDSAGFRAATQDYAQSESGQAWLQGGREQYRQQQEQQRQQQDQNPARAAERPPLQEAPPAQQAQPPAPTQQLPQSPSPPAPRLPGM
ncbi:DUF2235 domain-containing protein [Lysobacter firmicutimachus]|uniref:DUF2235 domain-containing protein n=1 Tax=Lysobacter firmicutimachus TaxID=1792846 RepID=A0AAU8MPQ2_9GAMM|nr:DUF2235 domain-containing protein [Lysobacter antibioticus]